MFRSPTTHGFGSVCDGIPNRQRENWLFATFNMGLRKYATFKIGFVKMPPSSCAVWLTCHSAPFTDLPFFFSHLQAPAKTNLPLMLSTRTWHPIITWNRRERAAREEYRASRIPYLLDVLRQYLGAAPISSTPRDTDLLDAADFLDAACRRSPRHRSGYMEPNLSRRYFGLPFPWFVFFDSCSTGYTYTVIRYM